MRTKITTTEQFDALIENKQDFLLYKYSSWLCRLSKTTRPFVEAYTEKNNIHTYVVHVRRYKVLKEYIATKTGIIHETPQVIIFKQGKITAHTSHMHITPEWLEQNG